MYMYVCVCVYIYIYIYIYTYIHTYTSPLFLAGKKKTGFHGQNQCHE